MIKTYGSRMVGSIVNERERERFKNHWNEHYSSQIWQSYIADVIGFIRQKAKLQKQE